MYDSWNFKISLVGLDTILTLCDLWVLLPLILFGVLLASTSDSFPFMYTDQCSAGGLSAYLWGSLPSPLLCPATTSCLCSPGPSPPPPFRESTRLCLGSSSLCPVLETQRSNLVAVIDWLCSSSLRDHSRLLPDIQCLEMILSCIFCF